MHFPKSMDQFQNIKTEYLLGEKEIVIWHIRCSVSDMKTLTSPTEFKSKSLSWSTKVIMKVQKVVTVMQLTRGSLGF
jgi:hypothetical protein